MSPLRPTESNRVSRGALPNAVASAGPSTMRDERLAAERVQVNLNRPVMMLRRKFGSSPPVGVVCETKSNTLPSFMP